MQNPCSPAFAGYASYRLWPALPAIVAFTLALIAAIFWGTGNVAQKYLLGSMSDVELLGSRGTLGFLTILPFAILELARRPELFGQFRRFWKSLAMCVLGFFVAISLQTFGATTASATVVGFLINLNVIFVPLLLVFHHGQALCRPKFAACLTCVTGTAMLSGGMAFNWAWGELLCILAAVGFAYWTLGLARVSRQMNAPFCCTALLLLPFPALLTLTGNWDVFGASMGDSDLQWPLLYIGVGSTGISFLCAALAQRYLNPVVAALTYSLEAVFGAATAYVVLGEYMTPLSLLGAGVLIGGIMAAHMIEAGRMQPDSMPQRKVRPQNITYSIG